eukprot:CCRYP_017818-RA/>CCRYP_017818-RA protein AED:0.47 eAED:0.36 QI:0/0/0/1/0/0/3/0/323
MLDQIIIHLVKVVMISINTLPHKNGISTIMSPREIVLKMKMDFKKHCRVWFRAYVEAGIDETITNTLCDRTEECIVLGPTGKLQGSIACFNLDTGQVVSHHTVTALPIPDQAWDDEEPDIDEGLVEDDTDGMADVLAEFPGIDLVLDHEDGVIADDPQPPVWAIADRVLTNANLSTGTAGDNITGVNTPDDNDLNTPEDNLQFVTDDKHNNNQEDSDSIEIVNPLAPNNMEEEAVTKELMQIHNMATFKPMDTHELTREQRIQELLSLMLLTQMRYGKIKGRACNNGSKQQEYIEKESATSLTVATDSLMITAAIDAVEWEIL